MTIIRVVPVIMMSEGGRGVEKGMEKGDGGERSAAASAPI